jgi:uncharacterized protein HemX
MEEQPPLAVAPEKPKTGKRPLLIVLFVCVLLLVVTLALSHRALQQRNAKHQQALQAQAVEQKKDRQQKQCQEYAQELNDSFDAVDCSKFK